MNSALIVGAGGFLGGALASALENAQAPPRSIVDLVRPIPEEIFAAADLRYVIICAAISDVEKCFQDRAQSDLVNVTGTRNLLEQVKAHGLVPVFFSSDYVFAPKNRALVEEDLREPTTVYGRQKLAIEQFIEQTFDEFLIFRTSKLMSKTIHPRNILFPVVRDLTAAKDQRAFEDQWINPVFVEDIALALRAADQRQLRGHFHLGTRRAFTRLELPRFAAEALGVSASSIIPMRLDEAPVSETRPSHHLLNASKFERAAEFQFAEITPETLRRLLPPPACDKGKFI